MSFELAPRRSEGVADRDVDVLVRAVAWVVVVDDPRRPSVG